MPCYHPIRAWMNEQGDAVHLAPPTGTATLELPCGHCLGCLTRRAQEWAIRAEHEASLYEHNCFLTLTYDEKGLPPDAHLAPQHLRTFIKLLRQERTRAFRRAQRKRSPIPTLLRSDLRERVRYLACGEYGAAGRPHYHLLLFNCDFGDKYQVAKGLYQSPTIDKLWKLGAHRLGTLTGASANYVAQYTIKKQGEPPCDENGVIRPAPFIRMSLKPGIGADWIKKYKTDAQHGYLVTDGEKQPVPRFYRKTLTKIDPLLAEQVVWRAAQAARTARASVPQQQQQKQQQLDAMEAIHISRNQLYASRNL